VSPPTRHRRLPASVHPLAGVAAFAYIFLSGGQLSNDHYMHLSLAQQMLLGDVPGRDFVDPGMPLMYMLSALVQHVSPGPFSEVVLTSALLGVAAALTSALVHRLTGSLRASLAAVAIQVMLDPRLYGYPKILVPAAVLWAIGRYTVAPTGGRQLAMAVIAGLSILLRHDLGLFAFAAVLCGIAVHRAPDWRAAAGDGSRVAGVVLLVLTPYLALMQFAEGLTESIREGLEFSKGEAHQLLLPWDRLPSVADGGATDPSIVLYVTAYLLVPAALALVIARDEPRSVRATTAAALTLLSCYCLVVLRHPLPARVPDLAAILAIVGVTVVTAAARRLARLRVAPMRAAAAVALVLASAWPLAATWRIGRPIEHFDETRIASGLPKVLRHVEARVEDGTRWPWSAYWPTGEMPEVVRYVSACTAPGDRILTTWFAPEYHFFARRGFAAGHSFFAPGPAFATTKDVGKMVRRLTAEPVPLVLRNEATSAVFAARYPALDAFVTLHYDWFGEFTLRDGSVIRLGRRRGLRAHTRFGPLGWPCGFDAVTTARAAHGGR
jgi:hypothetical protein